MREHIFQPNQSLMVWGNITEVDHQRIFMVETMSNSQRSLVPRIIVILLLAGFMGPILVNLLFDVVQKIFAG